MKQQIVWDRTWARKFSPFLCSIFMFSYLENDQFGKATHKLFVPEGNLMAIYYEKKEYTALVKNYEKFLRRQNMAQYARYYEGVFQKYLDYCRSVGEIDPAKLDQKTLSKTFRDLSRRMTLSSDYQFMAFLVVVGPALELENILAGQPGGAEKIQFITAPYQHTQIFKARLELLRLAKAKKYSALKAFAKKYAWLPVYEPWDNPWTESTFRTQVKHMKDPAKELKAATAHDAADQKKYKKYLAGLKDKKFKKLVEIVHYFSYLKEMRDDYRRHGYYLLRPFLKKLARRLGVTYAELNHMTNLEIQASIDKGKLTVTRAELAKRQKAFALILEGGKLKVLSGKPAADLGKKMLPKTSNEITGMVANPGQVTGNAAIVYHQGEFKKFKPGQILITTMTHPEFLPIMKKAVAVVTDEGGITCHAAITARELGIPCIIGTKNATHTFKDGDKIEVDATQGIVRRLS